MHQATDPRCIAAWHAAAHRCAGKWLSGAARLTARLRWLAYRLAVIESGAVATEYSFLIAFIAIVAAIGMVLLGDDLRDYFEAMATALDNASQPTADPFAT